MTLAEWCVRWRMPPEALRELADSITYGVTSTVRNESLVQQLVRLEAPRKGCRLWRNNVGAAKTDTGSYVRWGLANDSAALNARVKSADLIGFDDLGRFLSVECKPTSWRFNPNDSHEQAQMAWAMIVNAGGGRGIFARGPEAL